MIMVIDMYRDGSTMFKRSTIVSNTKPIMLKIKPFSVHYSRNTNSIKLTMYLKLSSTAFKNNLTNYNNNIIDMYSRMYLTSNPTMTYISFILVPCN
jgi:hypothetical protein